MVAAIESIKARITFDLTSKTSRFGTPLIAAESEPRRFGQSELWRKLPITDLQSNEIPFSNFYPMRVIHNASLTYQETADDVVNASFPLNRPTIRSGKAKKMKN